MTSVKHLMLLMLPVVFTSTLVAQAPIPDLTLRVAVRQKEDGRIDPGIHLLTLQCQSQICWLTAVSLNQCGNTLGTEAFPVVVDISSTQDGSLRVANLGDTLRVEHVSTDIGGRSTNTFAFGYELYSEGSFARLVSFSGGFVKHSSLLERVISVEYIPFRRLAQAAKLDCPVLVPGVDLSDFDDLVDTFGEQDKLLLKRIAKDPNQPFLTDDRRGRRLFPEYDRMKADGSQFSDEQWQQYVKEYLDERDMWLKAHGVSEAARRQIRQYQSGVLLAQLKK